MADITTIAIKVDNADVPKATQSLEAMTVSGTKAEAAAGRLTRRMALLEIEARNVDAAMEASTRSSFRLTGGMGGLASAMQAVAGALVVRELIATADAYTNMHSRIKLATSGTAELAKVEQQLFAVSQQTRTGMESNVALFTALSRSTKSLGIDQTQLIGITKTIAQSFVVSGASASETSAAVRQLSQAFASGVLRGDEFNSIAENAPRLQQAVAASLHVSIGALRQMATEGKLTGAVIAKALIEQGAQINSEFAQMPLTVGGAMQQFKNALLVGVGAIDSAQGSSSGLASAISSIADAVGPVSRTINAFFGGIALMAADAAIAVEKMKASIGGVGGKMVGMGTALQGIPGLGGVGSLISSVGASAVGSDDDTVRLMEKQRDFLAERLTKLPELTAANNAHGKSITGIIAPTKEWLALQKEIASIMTEAIVAVDNAQAKRLEGIRGLQDEESAQERLLAAANLGTDALKAQMDAEEINNRVRSAGILLGDEEYTEAVRSAKAITDKKNEIEKLTKAESDLQDMIKKGVETLRKVTKEGTENQKKDDEDYVKDIRNIWREGAGRIAADFVKSMSRGFEEVYSLAVKLMKRMEDAKKASGVGYTALKYGAAAIGGGLAGYSAGSAVGANGGSAAQAALGGAASGAMAGAAFGPWGALAGGIAGAAAGLLGFGKAAAEAAKQMAEAQKAVRLSISGAEADARGDTIGAGTARIHAEIESMRKAVEDAFSGGGSGSATVRARNVELARLNALEVQRIQQLRDEAALTLARLNQDINVQILRNNGDADAADAMEKAIEQERRFIELRKAGITEATLSELQQSEAKRDADAAALAAANALKEASEAAAAAAEAAAEKARAQAQAVEDINVELLNAQGRTGEGADLQFQLEQQRRLDDAKKSQSDDYVAKLLELQQLQRDQRAAQGLIDATTGPSSAYGGGRGATAAQSAVSATVTERTSLMIVDILRQIEKNTEKDGGPAGSSNGGTTWNINIRKELTQENIEDIVDEFRDRITTIANEDLGTAKQQATLRSGNVAR